MGTLRTVAWGLLVVVIDLKINQLDLLVDPIGWAIALFALLRLRELHPAFGAASAAAALGLAVSVPDWLGVDGLPISLLTGIAVLGLVVAVCTAIMELVPAKRHVADQLRKWELGLAVAFVPLDLLLRVDDGAARGP